MLSSRLVGWLYAKAVEDSLARRIACVAIQAAMDRGIFLPEMGPGLVMTS